MPNVIAGRNRHPSMMDPKHTPFERANAFFDLGAMEGYVGHDSVLRGHMKLTSADFSPSPSHPHRATTTFTLTVPPSLCNMSGTLHGGAVALIFDMCTSITIAICAKEGFWDSGHVSRTLNCTYLRPAKEGQKVVVESEVIHLGKRMGVVTGAIRGAEGEENEGKVFYTCEHGKASLGGASL